MAHFILNGKHPLTLAWVLPSSCLHVQYKLPHSPVFHKHSEKCGESLRPCSDPVCCNQMFADCRDGIFHWCFHLDFICSKVSVAAKKKRWWLFCALFQLHTFTPYLRWLSLADRLDITTSQRFFRTINMAGHSCVPMRSS